MSAPPAQSPALQARPGAASAASSRGKTGQIRCMNGKEWQDRSAFNPKRLREYEESRRSNRAITPYNSFISCKAHSGHNPFDKQCQGGCLRILPLEKFSKNSRRLGKYKCMDCTQHQLYLQPHATVPAPNTLLDTTEKDELAQARLRRKAKLAAALAAEDEDDEDDDSLYRDDQSVLSGAYSAGSTVSGAITGSRSVYSSRYSEAGTGYSSQNQPPHMRSENGSAATSALAARLNQDSSSLSGNAWRTQGFFSDSYAAVSTSSNAGYAPSDALLTDGQSTLGPEDSGSVAAAPDDDEESNNPPTAQRKIIADHTTVTEFFQTEESWRADQVKESLSSGNWVKLPGRKTLPEVPRYLREGEDNFDDDAYSYDGESEDEL